MWLTSSISVQKVVSGTHGCWSSMTTCGVLVIGSHYMMSPDGVAKTWSLFPWWLCEPEVVARIYLVRDLCCPMVILHVLECVPALCWSHGSCVGRGPEDCKIQVGVLLQLSTVCTFVGMLQRHEYRLGCILVSWLHLMVE